jgi:hypothetical protein
LPHNKAKKASKKKPGVTIEETWGCARLEGASKWPNSTIDTRLIMLLLLMVVIMIVQKDCVASTAQINNLLAVHLVKIYCIEHCTLLRCGYKNTNYQKTFLSSTPGRNRKLLS